MYYYQVKLIKHIHSNFSAVSSDDVWLEKNISLPFPPYKGLCIKYDNFEADINNEAEIYFNLETQQFKVYVESDKTMYDYKLSPINGKSNTPEPNFESIVNEWLEEGWERSVK